MMNIERNSYLIRTNAPKTDNMPLTAKDYLNIGYMAGRYGINLSGNPNEVNPMIYTPQGTYVNINSCTSKLFEKNLSQSGILFDRVA